MLPAEPTRSDERYEVLRPLGEGGVGSVYLAKDRDSGELVALKRLRRVDANSVQQLKREFRTLADLHHPNLIELYDLAHANDGWSLCMEYVEGSDLLHHLGRAPSDSAEREVGATQGHDAGHSVQVSPQLIAAFKQL